MGAAASSGTGARLGALRAERQLTIEQIAGVLGFSKRQILLLEADDYAALPPPVVVRGMVRAYARYLGIDSADLLARLPAAAAPVTAPLVGDFMEVSFSSRGGPRHSLAWWSVGVIVVALVVYLIADHGIPAYLLPSSQSDAAPVAESPDLPAGAVANATDTEPGIRADAASPAGTASSPGAPGAGSVGEPASTSSAVTAVPAATPASGPAPAVVPVMPQAAGSAVVGMMGPSFAPALPGAGVFVPAPTAPVSSAAPGAGGDRAAAPAAAAASQPPAGTSAADASAERSPTGRTHKIAFRFSRFAWVELRDAKGTVLFTGAHAPGTERSVVGVAPLRLVVGSAAAVEVNYDGQIIDLAPHAVGSVARLTLE
jgi:cytoskeleton protein RodZ